MQWYERLDEKIRDYLPDMTVERDVPMSRHTSFHVGGPVRLMALPKTAGEAKAALLSAKELDLDPFFLGNGTNLLVPDAGAQRFLIKPAGKYSVGSLNRVWEADGLLCAGAAVSLANLAGCALGRSLTGLEFAQGIPGSVGGGVTMNAGAYGGELVQVLDSVTALLSNEMFRADGTLDADAPERLERELLAFSRQMRCCVFVSDYIYADGGQYDAWTEAYRRGLARLDRALAAACENAAELCCAQTYWYKGGFDR